MFHHVCRWEWRARQQTSRASVASPATEAAGSGGWCSSQRGRPGQPPHPDSQGPSQPLQAVCWVAALHLSISAASAQRSATSPRQHEGPCATSISCLQWQPYIWAFKVRLLRAGQPLHPDNPKTLTLSQSCLPVAALHLSIQGASAQSGSAISSRQPKDPHTVPKLFASGSPTFEHSRCVCSERVSHFIQTTQRPSHCPKAVCQRQPYIWAIWLCPISWGMDAKDREYVLCVMTALKSLCEMSRHMMNSKKPELEYGFSLLRPIRDGCPEMF